MERILYLGCSTRDPIYHRVYYRVVEYDYRGHRLYVVEDNTEDDRSFGHSLQNVFRNKRDAIERFNGFVDKCDKVKL